MMISGKCYSNDMVINKDRNSSDLADFNCQREAANSQLKRDAWREYQRRLFVEISMGHFLDR